uniref:Uncharacterized protein n=1 Tax=Cacopsylla melanoneura TaxID=428564 RepID=A0A8D8RHM3_9HEMI
MNEPCPVLVEGLTVPEVFGDRMTMLLGLVKILCPPNMPEVCTGVRTLRWTASCSRVVVPSCDITAIPPKPPRPAGTRNCCMVGNCCTRFSGCIDVAISWLLKFPLFGRINVCSIGCANVC